MNFENQEFSKRTKKVMILDVETAGNIGSPLIYDIGYTIMEKTSGKILERRGFLIKEIWENTKLMNSAYYSWKVPLYADKVRDLLTWTGAINHILARASNYNCEIFAYNSDFDTRAINSTNKHLNKRELKVPAHCIWNLALQTICTTTKYQKFCVENDLLTESKKFYSTSAETVHKYLTGELDFIEEHMALEDCDIESLILDTIFKKRKPMNYESRNLIFSVAKIKPNTQFTLGI